MDIYYNLKPFSLKLFKNYKNVNRFNFMNKCPYCGKENKLIALTAPRYMARGSSEAMHSLNICAECKTILDNNGSIKSPSGDFMAYIPDFKK